MHKKIIYSFLLLTILLGHSFAADVCSRMAIINYQEVLVDTNTHQKGEGLRYHLEKDDVAKSYLDTYQKGTEIKWQNAVLGTAGTGLALAGLIIQDNSERKKQYVVGGVALLIINFLTAKTFEYNNENNLMKAVQEYNKRNLPKIYFGPSQSSYKSDREGPELFVAKNWEF